MGVSGTNAGQRSRSGFASTLAFALAGVALASGAAKFLVDWIRGSDECGTVFACVLDVLIWTALVSSILAVIVGFVALARRSGHLVRAMAGIVFGMVLGGLVLSASPLGTYVCGSSTA